jgi:RNA polymerase primary sigma factor
MRKLGRCANLGTVSGVTGPPPLSYPGALTVRQEKSLVVAAEGGDAEASRRLVEVFMPAIYGIARGFPTGAGVELQELQQTGVVGLLVAARRYNPRLNTPFWAYASYWVRKAMQDLVAELARPVTMSDRAVRSLARIKAEKRQYLQANGSEPTTEQLSDATGFTRDQLERLQAAERVDTSETVEDSIVDPRAEQAFELVLDYMELREVREAANRLTERQRTVIRAHYGLGQPAQTLDEIGDTLGLTAERARQIEADALSRMRDALVQPMVA